MIQFHFVSTRLFCCTSKIASFKLIAKSQKLTSKTKLVAENSNFVHP